MNYKKAKKKWMEMGGIKHLQHVARRFNISFHHEYLYLKYAGVIIGKQRSSDTAHIKKKQPCEIYAIYEQFHNIEMFHIANKVLSKSSIRYLYAVSKYDKADDVKKVNEAIKNDR